MIQPPILVGLKVCHEAIIEETTKRVTLVNCFRRLEVSSFPSPTQRFKVCAVLTDALGDMRLSIAIEHQQSLDEIYRNFWRVNFTDPLRERWFLLSVSGCSFPEPGGYRVNLYAETEIIGQAVIKVVKKGE